MMQVALAPSTRAHRLQQTRPNDEKPNEDMICGKNSDV